MRLKEYEIVIEPREVVFEHITADKLFTKTLNIKNVGNKSKRMELFRSSNKAFKLLVKNPELPVPPGMEIAAIVEFQSSAIMDYNDKLVVCIDDREVDIPLRAFPAKPILKTTDVVDFGVQAANNKTISSTLKITNTGAIDGDFVFSYKGEHTITFTPSKGTVPPYSSIDVRVDFFTKIATVVDEKVNLIFQGSEKPHILNIKVNVMKKTLELLSPGGNAKVERIDFGSCYYGCNLTNLSILYNNSPEPIKYAMILEEKGVGAEIGAELSKSTGALKAQKSDYNEEDFCPLDKLVSAFPNNGTMEPFEQRPIFFRFTPQYSNPKTGFQTTLKPPPRRDYAVFLYFEGLGSHQRTEVAITGTALPILLKSEPNELDFGTCPIGQKLELTTVLTNESELKDVRYRFDKIANFTVSPACGRIPPRTKKTILISFVPHQIGKCNYTLNCNVTDKVADEDNPLVVNDKSILDLPIKLNAEAISLNIIPTPKHSGGFMPLITNEVGLNVNTTVGDLKSFVPKIAIQNAPNDKLHRNSYAERIRAGKEHEYKIAYPNDRAKSIAPFNRDEKYKTLFTHVDRYNYVDPDYAYTNDERMKVEKHKLIYQNYIRQLKYIREEKTRIKEHMIYEGDKDLGLVPAGGLKPQQLTLRDLEEEAAKNLGFQVNPKWKLLNSDDLAQHEINLKSSPAKEGLSSVPTSLKEKEKCNIQLTPAELFKIIVTPSVIDFDEVVIKSSAVKHLDFLNTLDQPIFVELETDCVELRQSSPLSQVIPPKSKGTFPIVFESSVIQSFQRSISYRINNFYRHHVIVLAETKLPSLILSSNHIVLNQLTGVQPELCYRTSITIKNPFNATTEFTWMPIYGDQGTAFSIRPATGIIEPFKELDCEIVWHGSYLAPLHGTFSLLVQGGEPLKLTCEAKLGSPVAQFINRRTNIGRIPVNTSTTRTFYLTNHGTVHAYFQVLDNEPIPGMIVSPRFGVIPVGGNAPIKIEMNPNDVVKFDARVLVQIRGSKTIELRLSGESEEPYIDISVPKFDFGGIYSGATCAIPFLLSNKSRVKGFVEFNLSNYPDFSLKLNDSYSTQEKKRLTSTANVYRVDIDSEQALKMELLFNPTEVASYEFDLQVTINKPARSIFDDSKTMITELKLLDNLTARDKTPATPKSQKQPLMNYVPIRHVSAIGLRYALHLSTSKLHFEIPLLYLERLQHGGFYEAKSILMTNHSHRKIKWCFDMRKSNSVLERGIFRLCDGSMAPFVSTDPKAIGPEGEISPNESFQIMVLFSPDKPGKYECNIPIIVNDNFEQPYYRIEVTGELLTPKMSFEPNLLVMKPIPLGLPRMERIIIRPSGYESKSSLSVEIPDVETLDGEKIQVLSVEFLTDNIILPNNQSQPKEISIAFQCEKPISTTVQLKFIDDQNHVYPYNVVVTADNSLFTCYGFLADHQSEYHIVLEEGKIMKGSRNLMPSRQSGVSGEPILRPYSGASRLSRTRTASPTFDLNMSSYDPTPIKSNDANEIQTMSAITQSKKTADPNRITPFSRTQESVMFPPSESEAGIFSAETLKGLQRWFSCNGWPTSYNPVKIPESFRGGVSRKPLDDNMEKLPQQDAMKSDIKTIYDMLGFLCGKTLPGIPMAAPVPHDSVDRMKQFIWQHNVLLTFLKTQGGCVSFVNPEYLLDSNEFKCFLSETQSNVSKLLDGFKDSTEKPADSADVTIDSFESVSKKAWLDCLLQILKVLVINRITPKSFKNLQLPDGMDQPLPIIKPDPLISNIYSIGERILLTWLNHCYSHNKDKIWNGYGRDSAPARWIVNFDIDVTDSLALGATIGAYCPFLIESHLKRMYVQANTAEKCFHNALILIESCKYIGLDYDINALDITDPNPITLCLFCAYLYDTLPNYLPKSIIDFTGSLNEVVSKQIKVSNPSTKNILYQAKVIGPNAENFELPKGNLIALNAKAKLSLPITFQGKNLKPGNAFLVLVAKKQETMIAATICFFLKTNIDELTAKKILRYTSPLYKLNEIIVDVENPFSESGEFTVSIIESDNKKGIIRNPFNEKKEINTKASISDQPILSAFHTKIKSIKLDSNGKSPLPITYLPLQLIRTTAVIIFTNDSIGEFIYYLEGNSILPESFKTIVDESALDSHRCKFIKSTRAGDYSLAFRCYVGDHVEIKMRMPVHNYQREEALTKATQLRMSNEEIRRRQVHNILSSKSLLEALDKLTINRQAMPSENRKSLADSSRKSKNDNEVIFNVESTNNVLFTMPKTLMITQDDAKSDENMLPFTVKFSSDKQGIFSTLVQLQSPPDDIRCIPIEIKVTDRVITESSIATLEFNSCVFDSISQPIPIKNLTENPCHYEVEIVLNSRDKNVFNGVKKFTVKPKEFYIYELKFSPLAEEIFEGELRLNNTTEGIQTKYLLVGKGEKSPALAEINVETRVGEIVEQKVLIPNRGNKKICFYVQSSIPFIRGPEKILLLPNRKEPYNFEICAPQRGEYKGVIAFRPGEWPVKDIDSDGDEIITIDDEDKPQNFTLWVSCNIKVQPPPPQTVVNIETACLDTCKVLVPLSNPFDRDIELEATIDGVYLEGEKSIKVAAKAKSKYELKFNPRQVGSFKGSLKFVSEETGEFWYELSMLSTDPAPLELPTMQCEVGRYIKDFIRLSNPLEIPATFIISGSNTGNFSIELPLKNTVTIDAHSHLDIPIVFTPSTVGNGDHYAEFKFSNEIIGTLQYIVNGIGLMPTQQEFINISAEVGNSELCSISFKNSTDSAIYCDLILYDGVPNDQGRLDHLQPLMSNKTFNILLDYTENIRVPPKGTVDIPVVFCPEELKQYKCTILITVRREARMSWADKDKPHLGELQWIYPIKGVAALYPIKNKTPLSLECMVKNRLEKRMEILLSDVDSETVDGEKPNIIRSITPQESRPHIPDGALVGEGRHIEREFQYTILFKNDNNSNIDIAKNSVGIKLVRYHRERTTGLVTLVFDAVFCPSKSFVTDAFLQIETTLGGTWRYPIRLIATEPPPDDTIVIEAAGLNQESIVGFRLFSKSNNPIPFNAHLMPTGDQVFTVFPTSGELLPESANGTLIKIAFNPPSYGKIYQNQLVVTTNEYQWKYVIKGVPPEYVKPRAESAIASHIDPRLKRLGASKKRNFVLENTYLESTATSSPLKGKSLMPMKYYSQP